MFWKKSKIGEFHNTSKRNVNIMVDENIDFCQFLTGL